MLEKLTIAIEKNFTRVNDSFFNKYFSQSKYPSTTMFLNIPSTQAKGELFPRHPRFFRESRAAINRGITSPYKEVEKRAALDVLERACCIEGNGKDK